MVLENFFLTIGRKSKFLVKIIVIKTTLINLPILNLVKKFLLTYKLQWSDWYTRRAHDPKSVSSNLACDKKNLKILYFYSKNKNQKKSVLALIE